MFKSATEQAFDPCVVLVELPFQYGEGMNGENHVAKALNRVTGRLGWRDVEKGSFGAIIPDGAKALIKLNCMLHATKQRPRGN